MLLGGGVYESVVVAPNYRSNLPQSLDHLRHFMKVTTPANFFRIVSPATMILLVATVIVCWGSIPARWWFIAALTALILADSITYGFHYPRNKVLFIEPLSSDTDMLRRLAQEWATGNLVRIVLMVIAIVNATYGMILLAQIPLT
jgi:uncharacterized membrane protein